MINVVMLGGNGYIGRATTKAWLRKAPDTMFYVVSGSGRNALQSTQIVNIAANADMYDDVRPHLPGQIDYIVDFIGGVKVSEGSSMTLLQMNMEPAMTMARIAEEHHVKAQGYIQGSLGNKAFVEAKAEVAKRLRAMRIPAVIVNPTLVYGEGRDDGLAKMVPLLKFLGFFSKKLRPVSVEEVATEMVNKMLNYT